VLEGGQSEKCSARARPCRDVAPASAPRAAAASASGPASVPSRGRLACSPGLPRPKAPRSHPARAVPCGVCTSVRSRPPAQCRTELPDRPRLPALPFSHSPARASPIRAAAPLLDVQTNPGGQPSHRRCPDRAAAASSNPGRPRAKAALPPPPLPLP
jgi:hypothetical protein